MNVFKTFLLTLMNLILLPILLVNFMVVLANLGVNWGEIFTGFTFDLPTEDTYFGFSSFFIALQRFPVINTLFGGLSTLFNTWTTIIGDIVNLAASNSSDFVEILKVIAKILISPVTIIADVLQFVLLLLSDIVDLITWFVLLISGKFNLPLI